MINPNDYEGNPAPLPKFIDSTLTLKEAVALAAEHNLMLVPVHMYRNRDDWYSEETPWPEPIATWWCATKMMADPSAYFPIAEFIRDEGFNGEPYLDYIEEVLDADTIAPTIQEAVRYAMEKIKGK